MGIVLNPVAYRVGYNYSWSDAWYVSHRISLYSVYVHNILSFKMLLIFVFFRYFNYKKSYWLYSHINVYIYNDKIFVNLFLYDSNEVQLYYDIARRYKRLAWRKIYMISYWFKKQTMDRQSLIKRLAYFTRTVRFFFDLLMYEDMVIALRKDQRSFYNVRNLYYSRLLKKISNNSNYSFFYNKSLKKFATLFKLDDDKYRIGWIPWEELEAYYFGLANMTETMNQLSIKWWVARYNFVYKYFFKKIKQNEDLTLKINSILYNERLRLEKLREKENLLNYKKKKNVNKYNKFIEKVLSKQENFKYSKYSDLNKNLPSIDRDLINSIISQPNYDSRKKKNYKFIFGSKSKFDNYSDLFFNNKLKKGKFFKFKFIKDLSLVKYTDKDRFTVKYFNKNNNKIGYYVRMSNKLLITFLLFMNNFFNKITRMYESQLFGKKWLRKFLKFYVYFFLKKKIVKFYANFVQFIALYLNLNINVKVFVLNNNSLGAIFISRFLAIGLRNRYDYLDMIIPIKKSLRKQMYVKRWSPLAEEKVDKLSLKKDVRYFEKDFYIFKDILYSKVYIIDSFIGYRNKFFPRIFYYNSVLFKRLQVNKMFVLKGHVFNKLKIRKLNFIKKNFNCENFSKSYLDDNSINKVKMLSLQEKKEVNNNKFVQKFLKKQLDLELNKTNNVLLKYKNFFFFNFINLRFLFSFLFFNLNKNLLNSIKFFLFFLKNKGILFLSYKEIKILFKFQFLSIVFNIFNKFFFFKIFRKFFFIKKRIFVFNIIVNFYLFFKNFFFFCIVFRQEANKHFRSYHTFNDWLFFFGNTILRNSLRINKIFYNTENKDKFRFFYKSYIRDFSINVKDRKRLVDNAFKYAKYWSINWWKKYFLKNEYLKHYKNKYGKSVYKKYIKNPKIIKLGKRIYAINLIDPIDWDKSKKKEKGVYYSKWKRVDCKHYYEKSKYWPKYYYKEKCSFLKTFVYFVFNFSKFKHLLKFRNLKKRRLPYFATYFFEILKARFYGSLKKKKLINFKIDFLNANINFFSRFFYSYKVFNNLYSIKNFYVNFELVDFYKKYFYKNYTLSLRNKFYFLIKHDIINLLIYLKFLYKNLDDKKFFFKFKQEKYFFHQLLNDVIKKFNNGFLILSKKVGKDDVLFDYIIRNFTFKQFLFVKIFRNFLSSFGDNELFYNNLDYFDNISKYVKKFTYLKKMPLWKKEKEIKYLYLIILIGFFKQYLLLLKKILFFFNNRNLNSIFNYVIIYKKFLNFYKLKTLRSLNFNYANNMYFFLFNELKYYNNKRFFLNISLYKKRYLSIMKFFDFEKKNLFFSVIKRKQIKSILLYKYKRMKFFDDNNAFLYGYKFHFVGRFTRKQQSANMWFRKGSLANSSASVNVDYAIYTVIMRYSVCTVKVWLYKSNKSPFYKYRVF